MSPFEVRLPPFRVVEGEFGDQQGRAGWNAHNLNLWHLLFSKFELENEVHMSMWQKGLHSLDFFNSIQIQTSLLPMSSPGSRPAKAADYLLVCVSLATSPNFVQATQDSNARGVKHARSASHPGDMQQAMLGGDPDSDDYPRSASHAYASSRAGSTSSFSPATDFVGSLPSTRVCKLITLTARLMSLLTDATNSGRGVHFPVDNLGFLTVLLQKTAKPEGFGLCKQFDCYYKVTGKNCDLSVRSSR